MQITLNPEQEASFSQLATRTGHSIEDLVREAIDLYVAAKGEATLLFEEADSLFSKRSKVQGSHDRYANQDENPKKP